MSDHGIVTEAGAIQFRRLLPGPIERVWASLTESDLRGAWLARGPMELRVGGRVELNFHHPDLSPGERAPEKYRQLEAGVTIRGRITACEPPRLLSYSWDDGPAPGSEVTFELSPQGDRVLLLLTHRRLDGRPAMLSFAAGWHAHLDILADHVSGAAPRPFWAMHTRLDREYEERL